MTTPTPQTPGAGATDSTLLTQAILFNAGRLGLTWQRQMATVVDGSNPAAITAKMDGDTAVLTMVSMIGALLAGQRVYVDVLPPSGLFVVGFVGSIAPIPGNVKTFTTSGGADTCTNAALETIDNIGAPFSFTKVGASGVTSLDITIHLSMYCTGSAPVDYAVGVRVAQGSTTTDTEIYPSVMNVLASHTPSSGAIKIGGFGPGACSITPLWRRRAGAGVMTRDAGDYLSLRVAEVNA